MSSKRVLVTGGSQGVGAETALRLRSDGYEVAIADKVNPQTDDFEFHSIDLADPESIRNVVDQVGAGLYGLVNCAGVPGTLDPRTVMAVNFAGLRTLTEACLEHSSLQAVVHVSSLSAAGWAAETDRLVPLLKTTSFNEALEYADTLDLSSNEAYVFSKQAVILLTQWQGAQLLSQDVRVNCVSPGPIETRLLKDFRTSMGDEHISRAINLQGRAATAKDIAPVIAFLIDADASWVSGSNINTDGGLHAVRQYSLAES